MCLKGFQGLWFSVLFSQAHLASASAAAAAVKICLLSGRTAEKESEIETTLGMETETETCQGIAVGIDQWIGIAAHAVITGTETDRTLPRRAGESAVAEITEQNRHMPQGGLPLGLPLGHRQPLERVETGTELQMQMQTEVTERTLRLIPTMQSSRMRRRSGGS